MTKGICKKVLTVGVDYKTPKGGIAYVLNAYSKFYKPFNFVTTSKGNSKVTKLFVLILAIFKYMVYMVLPSIKIVHIHGASYNSFYRKRIFINIAYVFGKKIIYHIHGAEFHLFISKNPEVSKTLKKCNEIVVLSKYWKKYFEEQIGLSNVSIINNICHYPKPILSIDKRKYLNLLFLGQIGVRKGVFDAIQAIGKDDVLRNAEIKLHIGGGGDVAELKRLIMNLNLEEKIVYHGWVSGEEKESLLSAADIYILPSFNEGLPISILEAMSYSLPIISSPVGGIPEVVINDVNGILVKPGNTEEIAKAIKLIMNDKTKLINMGNKSLDLVKPYLPNQVEESLIKLYRRVL